MGRTTKLRHAGYERERLQPRRPTGVASSAWFGDAWHLQKLSASVATRWCAGVSPWFVVLHVPRRIVSRNPRILWTIPTSEVAELLGHNSVETTQVYLHCVPQFASTITSPLDVLPAPDNVVPFVRAA